MEVLTAYVRENAPWPAKSSKSPERDFIKPPEGGSVSDSASNEATEPEEDSVQGVEPISGTPRTDIQAVLDVVSRREEDHVPEQHRVGLDLQRTDLREAILSEADLRETILIGAILIGANLRKAGLESADLQGADLREANFGGVSLGGANFGGVNLLRTKALTQQQIELVVGDERTTLPEGLQRPAAWSKGTDDQTKGD
jgi:hypothetical protein